MGLAPIIVNLKTYAEATGEKALNIGKAADTVAEEFGVSIGLAAQAVDIRLLSENLELPVYAQHVNSWSPGAHTGWASPSALAQAGATGTLINHSEHRLVLSDIEETISSAQKNGLLTLVCANSAPVSAALASLCPTAVAMEPPELIGGDVSVTTRPEAITNSVDVVRAVNRDVEIFVGAGVKIGEHVKLAVELGTQGVLLASGVAKAKDPHAALADLAKGYVSAKKD